MRIAFSKQLPSIDELNGVLKRHFSTLYSVKTFGIGQQSILVGKSTLVGAEIAVHDNEVSISSSPPSLFGGFLLTIGLTELAIFLLPFWVKEGFSPHTSYVALEREIGTFLKHKFE